MPVPLHTTVSRTRQAVGMTLRNRRALGVTVGTTLIYLLTYLYAIGTLRGGNGEFGVRVAQSPAQQLFRQTFGTFTYEPVALFRLGIVTYQFSLNTVIGLAIGLLVGLNIALSYLTWRQPAACGVGSQSAGFLAGIPALLSGTACCAPVIFLIIGVQATGVLLLAVELLLPISVALLVGSLLAIGRQVDPAVGAN